MSTKDRLRIRVAKLSFCEGAASDQAVLTRIATPAVTNVADTRLGQPKSFPSGAESIVAVIWNCWAWLMAITSITWAVYAQNRIVGFECLLVIISTIVALHKPTAAATLLRQFDSILARVAKRRVSAVLIVGLVALAGRAALLPRFPIPSPRVHDEFSYLLAGETFASGRLTNPTHPLWRHFETFHIDQTPTYMSMYPPAQGLALALGTVVAGNPVAGVLLGAAAMCAAICWALQGWLPPRWAFFGGLLIAVRIGMLSYFANSYWGGAVPAIGGALVIGALPRVKRFYRFRDAAVMAFGLALLANSRPYEGLLAATPIVVAVAIWLFRSDPPARQILMRRVALPISLIGVATAAAMLYYNARVFGSPLLMPYQVNRATYAVAPVFLWQPVATTPHYNHKEMQDFYLGFELNEFKAASSIGGRVEQTMWDVITFWDMYVGAAFTIPLIWMATTLRDRSNRILWIVSAVLLVFTVVGIFFRPHYAAPGMAVFIILLIQSLRRLSVWRWRNRKAGLFISRMVLPISAIVLGVVVCFPAEMAKQSPDFRWYYFRQNETARDRAIRYLQQQPGLHLVIVRYGLTHRSFDEWVFNSANIDRSKIVWARDMGAEENARLLRYFAGRSAWLAEPDKNGRISPYER